jgi:hypothetical protein
MKWLMSLRRPTPTFLAPARRRRFGHGSNVRSSLCGCGGLLRSPAKSDVGLSEGHEERVGNSGGCQTRSSSKSMVGFRAMVLSGR